MTDKEQIIIDGVNITGCAWCDFEPDAEPYCRINDGEDLGCEDNPNCYFKQLARKTQECEELKRKVELMMDCPDCKVDEYKKALEEIEGLVKNFCKDCDDYEDCNWEKEGCYYSLIPNLKDITNKAKDGNNE